MRRNDVVRSLAHVGWALREPEEFAARWDRGEATYAAGVWMALIAAAIAGTTCYGMTMGIGQGMVVIGKRGLLLTTAAGLAWAVPLPALYILNSIAGSKLRPGSTLLAALVTTSWGGLALLASLPINWLVTAAVPDLPGMTPTWAALAMFGFNILVFTGVGISMVDVFGRVVERLEPARGRQPMWFLVLVGVIGAQLFYLFGLFP